MGWGSRFKTALSQSTMAPRFALRLVPAEWTFGDLDLSSHGLPGAVGIMLPDAAPPSAARLNLGDWRQTFSQLSVGFHWHNPDPRYIVGAAPRGSILQLTMGFAGWAEADFEPIYTGTLQGIQRGQGGRWALQMRSVVSALQSRFTLVRDECELFYDEPNNVFANGGYTAGATTLNVTTTVGASRETGGNWLIQCTPSTGGPPVPDPFFLRATAQTPGTPGSYTVDSTAVLGTTAANLVNGDAVTVLPFVEDHPIDAARKILCSTGGATNGDYDTLPQNWGLNLPDGVIDHDDASYWKNQISPAAGATNWHIYATETQSDALSWLLSVLEPAGILLTERQGRLSLRAVFQPDNVPNFVAPITDDDLISIDGYDWFDQSTPYERGQIRYETPGGSLSSVSTLDSKPAIETETVSLSYISSNQSNWRTKTTSRLAKWMIRLPEVLEVTLRGWRLAGLAPGDFVEIRSKFWRPRVRADQPMIVLSCQPDWFGPPTTRLRLATVPTETEWI